MLLSISKTLLLICLCRADKLPKARWNYDRNLFVIKPRKNHAEIQLCRTVCRGGGSCPGEACFLLENQTFCFNVRAKILDQLCPHRHERSSCVCLVSRPGLFHECGPVTFCHVCHWLGKMRWPRSVPLFSASPPFGYISVCLSLSHPFSFPFFSLHSAS